MVDEPTAVVSPNGIAGRTFTRTATGVVPAVATPKVAPLHFVADGIARGKPLQGGIRTEVAGRLAAGQEPDA